MIYDERWSKLSGTDWDAFARAWLAELGSAKGVAQPGERPNWGLRVVQMNFTATAECQWAFVTAAMKQANSEDDFGHIAAGPVEHLLSKFGEDYIAVVEQVSATDSKFARMMKTVRRHMMTEEVWKRVRAIQEQSEAGQVEHWYSSSQLGSIMTLDRTEFVTVMCTGQFVKFDMAVNALKEARIPHQVQEETSTGLKLAMPVTAAAGPGRFFTVLVPAEYESKAQEVLSDLPFEITTNPGPWDFEPQPNAKKWLKIWIIAVLLLALASWITEIISRVLG